MASVQEADVWPDDENTLHQVPSPSRAVQTASGLDSSVMNLRRTWEFEQQPGDDASIVSEQPTSAPQDGVVASDNPAADPFQAAQTDREDRRKYLEQQQALDFFTKVVMKTDITDGKTDPSEALTEAIQWAGLDAEQTEVAILQEEYETVTAANEALTRDIEMLRARVVELEEEKEERFK